MTLARRARRVLRRVFRGRVRLERTTTLPPVFVGGTGRSGTTVTARVIGAHSAYHAFAIELKFIVRTGGLCDLATGRVGARAFRRRFEDRWLPRLLEQPAAPPLDRARAEEALRRLETDLRSDPWAASRAFTHRLLDPIAAAGGASGWVEMTPANALRAREVARMFPDARLIHSVRDGRDVACSVARRGWGPNDPDEALDWWAARFGRATAAFASLPPERTHTLAMEALIAHDRAGEYRRLLGFLGLPDDPAMRDHFETWVTVERAHLGRWVDDVPEERRAAFEAHFERLSEALANRTYDRDRRRRGRDPRTQGSSA